MYISCANVNLEGNGGKNGLENVFKGITNFFHVSMVFRGK